MIVPNFLWNLALKNALIECLSRFVARATWLGERIGGVEFPADVFACGDLSIPNGFSQIGYVSGASFVYALQLADVGDVSADGRVLEALDAGLRFIVEAWVREELNGRPGRKPTRGAREAGAQCAGLGPEPHRWRFGTLMAH